MTKLSTILAGIDEARWIGIDFSGSQPMWGPHCTRSNVWVAEVSYREGLHLDRLAPVQELQGDEKPFQRTAAYLSKGDFNAAAIDAPFSVPAVFLRNNTHRELLTKIHEIDKGKRCFPTASSFVTTLTQNETVKPPKPLRATEHYWKALGLNVRSTLWEKPRGGAPFAAASLALLCQAERPMWPWQKEGGGLLVEAFPAAQLLEWKLPCVKYSGNSNLDQRNRAAIVEGVIRRTELRVAAFESVMLRSADALDAVLCAFAAIAVSTRLVLPRDPQAPLDEGWIAVMQSLEH